MTTHQAKITITQVSEDPLELEISVGSVILAARSKGSPKMSANPAAVCPVCKGSGFSHENHKCQFCDGPAEETTDEEIQLTNSSPPDARALAKTLLNRIAEHPNAMKEIVISLRQSSESKQTREARDLITKARVFHDSHLWGDRITSTNEALDFIKNLANELENRL